MPCENYREALIEAAALGAAPADELRLHLDACASCRTAFIRELQLFSRIDSGLRATASRELPPAFLPRVRANLENVSTSKRRWMPFLIFAAASAAMVLAVFIAMRPRRTMDHAQARQTSTAPPREKPEASARREASGTPAILASSHSYRAEPWRTSVPANSSPSTELEVLVPPDEREAFARFISSQRERAGLVIAVVAAAPDDKDRLLSVKPLEIAELEVKPLESPASEIPDGRE